jgi:hypothetical protein
MDISIERVAEIVATATPESIRDTINASNIRPSQHYPKSFRFTAKFLSLGFLENLKNTKEIKDVFYHPSAPPPGLGMDGIASRYRIYLIFH